MPSRGQTIELGPAIVLRYAPGRFDPATLFEPMERRIERALLDLEDVVGDLPDPARYAVAVSRSPGQCFQDHQVQRSVHQISRTHASPFSGLGESCGETPVRSRGNVFDGGKRGQLAVAVALALA